MNDKYGSTDLNEFSGMKNGLTGVWKSERNENGKYKKKKMGGSFCNCRLKTGKSGGQFLARCQLAYASTVGHLTHWLSVIHNARDYTHGNHIINNYKMSAKKVMKDNMLKIIFLIYFIDLKYPRVWG